MHKTRIELEVLESHPGFISKGNRDSGFVNSRRKLTESPIFYREDNFISADLHTQEIFLIFLSTKPAKASYMILSCIYGSSKYGLEHLCSMFDTQHCKVLKTDSKHLVTRQS